MKFVKIFFSFLILALFSCTKLDERFRSEIESTSSGTISVTNLLTNAYNSLQTPFVDQSRFWAASQHTTDEVIGPTRGPDWDDNGVWRVLHSHQWNADHGFLRDTYRELLQTQYAASNVLEFNPSAQQAAEARFIRALSMFAVLDGWDQVPFREDLKDLKKTPVTLRGTEAVDYIISELNAIMASLPASPNYVANADAAKVLLMKLYLNKGVYANRAQPTFSPADMNQVITLADQLISSGKYQLNDVYFDNFAPNNDDLSKENIFTLYHENGDRGGNNQSRWYMGLHYNQKPSGWNGFTTLADLYDRFEQNDTRRSYNYPGLTNITGYNAGLLIGQQFGPGGVALTTRQGKPLAFTKEVKLKETDANTLELTGVRVIKYIPQFVNNDPNKLVEFPADNDYVIFRYADVLLMKAEAIMRGGTATSIAPATPLLLVNAIRAKRGASVLTNLTEQILLDERSRELYIEGWRRNDLIRFGKFLQPWTEKGQSDPSRLVFPIPNEQLAINPNLEQNPGY
jgi:hypothetical protein